MHLLRRPHHTPEQTLPAWDSPADPLGRFLASRESQLGSAWLQLSRASTPRPALSQLGARGLGSHTPAPLQLPGHLLALQQLKQKVTKQKDH